MNPHPTVTHFESPTNPTYQSDQSRGLCPRAGQRPVAFRLCLCLCLSLTIPASAQPSPAQPFITISPDGASFIQSPSNKPFRVWGVNYDHANSGQLIEEFWDDNWTTFEEDFNEIKDLGANVVRLHLQVASFMTAPDKPNTAELARLKKVVRLAESLNLYLDLTGLGCYHKQDIPPWYDALPEADRWQTQANFWRAIAQTCADSPAIFCYDLMNEPVLPGKNPDDGYLVGEPLGGKYFVQRIALEANARSRQQIAADWVNNLTSAIRSVDKRHLITVGVIPWAHTWPNAKPVFYDPVVSQNLDFVSVHFYPRKGEVDKALAALKVYDIGKPLIIEEMFPLKCGFDEMERFIDESKSFTDGYISFYWGKTIEDYQADKKELVSAIMAQWLKYYQSKSAEMIK